MSDESNYDLYDDSPWTREELQALAWQAAEGASWDGEDDDLAEME